MSTVAVTGINSYFAGTVLPKLEADPEIERIVGVDIKPMKAKSGKTDFHLEDVRSPNIKSLFQGVDTVLHLAFIVEEIHDKKKTHEINVEGSMYVFRACVECGVRKVVYPSSTASYGSHPDNPIGMTEEYPLKANEDSYYSSDKLAVELFMKEFFKDHPGIVLTVFRPPVIVGPNLSNFAADVFTRKVSFCIRERDPKIQFLHEEDLGEALYLAIKKDIPGTFNIAADDHSTMRSMTRISGTRLIKLPSWVLKPLANLFFALRLERGSQGWVSLMEHPVVVNNEKFKKVSGWQPRYATEEAFRNFLQSRG